jgi:sterol desaturase/sphingolipid hydroxylase (fatty acid hydroxylase superfamily)
MNNTLRLSSLSCRFDGFDPVLFFICHQIEVLYQFWIHTEYIRKLPAPIEYIFVTPFIIGAMKTYRQLL